MDPAGHAGEGSLILDDPIICCSEPRLRAVLIIFFTVVERVDRTIRT